MWLFKNLRRKRIKNKPCRDDWLKIIEANVPYYNSMPPDDKIELQQHILIFLSEKCFEGCGRLEITDEIKVTIAAYACILLLHRKTDYYPRLRSILVYPKTFVAPHKSYLPGGIIAEGDIPLRGQSWHKGPVILSWDDVRHSYADAHDGQNVVFHEFAHQIDSTGGESDSSEVLKRRSSFIAWARVLQKDFEKHKKAVSKNLPTLLSKYAATNEAEFFAVATEFFFEKPHQLKKAHTELYNELKRFYNQDPAAIIEHRTPNTER
jgi:Mlc titration factor MtfA (ptsG expression regulator)